jgi:cellulose biosynthesis protein BcsQ
VVWDTPTYGILVRQVLALSDVVVMPVALALFGLEGVANFFTLARATNPRAQVVILPTRHKTRQRVSDQALEALVAEMGEYGVHLGSGPGGEDGDEDENPRFYDGQEWLIVPERAVIEQAQAEGLTIFEYARRSRAASAYLRLADEIILRTKRTREVLDGDANGESVRKDAYSAGGG